MKEENLEALRANMDILISGLFVCHVSNEKAISLILQYEVLKKVVTYSILAYSSNKLIHYS